MKKLFEDNKSVLEDFVARIPRAENLSEFEKSRNRLIRLVVGSMTDQFKDWDELCQMNIAWIGDNFIRMLSDKDQELSKSQLDMIASRCFRFLLELDLSRGEGLDVTFENDVKLFAINRAEEFEREAKEQIQYACHAMPIAICKSVFNNAAIGSVKALNSSLKKIEQLQTKWDQELTGKKEAILEKIEQLQTKWDQELSEKEEEVNKLREALDEYKTAFNFVGLYAGFDKLAEEKIAEKKSTFRWLAVLGLLAVAPIIGELAYVIRVGIEALSIEKMSLVALPTISLVALLIYYFRVLLFNYKSVKSQLMQINLRKALCRFIQSYAEYSREMNEKNPGALARFEKIVFSEIMADEGNLPSMHDGVEQIANVIKSMKKS